MKNIDLRTECKQANVFLWQIAEAMGICDMTLSRKLRKELPQDQKDKIKTLIAEIKAGDN